MTLELGNKIIAEFMIEFCEPFKNDGGEGYHIKIGGIPNGQKMGIGKYGTKETVLKILLSFQYFYHTSWDWLMPVILKLGIEHIPTDISKAWQIAVNSILEK